MQVFKNFPAFYGTQRFITVFTRALHSPYPEPDRSSPYHPIPSYLSKIHFIRSIVHPPTSGLPSGFYPSGFPTSTLYAFRFSPIRATYTVHLILLDLIVLIILGEEYKLRSSSLCSFIQPILMCIPPW
jgi:hypothetical protein